MNAKVKEKNVFISQRRTFTPSRSHFAQTSDKQCIKSIRIWSYSGPYFPVFRLNTMRYEVSLYSVQMRENADQINSQYGHFLRSEVIGKKFLNSLKEVLKLF